MVDVNIAGLGVGRKNDSVVGNQLGLVLDDVLDVVALLHVAIAAVEVMADVWHLLHFAVVIINLPLLQVVGVTILAGRLHYVAIALGQLLIDILLLSEVVVVRVDQHVLVVIRYVVVLVDLQVLLNDTELDPLAQYLELWVLVTQKRCQVLVLHGSVSVGINQLPIELHLRLIHSVVLSLMIVGRDILRGDENMRLKWIEDHEQVRVSTFMVFGVNYFLNGFLNHPESIFQPLNRCISVLQAEHFDTLWLINLV